ARGLASALGTDAGYIEDASFWKLRERQLAQLPERSVLDVPRVRAERAGEAARLQRERRAGIVRGLTVEEAGAPECFRAVVELVAAATIQQATHTEVLEECDRRVEREFILREWRAQERRIVGNQQFASIAVTPEIRAIGHVNHAVVIEIRERVRALPVAAEGEALFMPLRGAAQPEDDRRGVRAERDELVGVARSIHAHVPRQAIRREHVRIHGGFPSLVVHLAEVDELRGGAGGGGQVLRDDLVARVLGVVGQYKADTIVE